MRSAASRSLIGFSSMDRSDKAVKAGGESSEPGCSIRAPVVTSVKGELMGASGEASGVISRGRFRFWAIDCVTKVVSARGRPCSSGFGELGLVLDRPRAARRDKPARPWPRPRPRMMRPRRCRGARLVNRIRGLRSHRRPRALCRPRCELSALLRSSAPGPCARASLAVIGRCSSWFASRPSCRPGSWVVPVEGLPGPDPSPPARGAAAPHDSRAR